MNRKENEREQIEKSFYIVGICIPCIGIMLVLLWRLLPGEWTERLLVPCMVYTFTGLYCPGCGGTRAVLALLEGRFFVSFLYHPIVLYGVVIYLWFMISHTIERLSGHKIPIGMKYREIYLWLALGIVVINIAVKDIALAAFGIDFFQFLDVM